MATKEEIERDYNALRNKHEKLKLRYKEVATKLQLARELLGRTVDHLSEIPPIGYIETGGGSVEPRRSFDQAMKIKKDN